MRSSARASLVMALMILPSLFPPSAHAHPLGFGVLEIADEAGGTRAFTLRLSPEEGEVAESVEITWPPGCTSSGERERVERDGTLVREGELRCREGLVGELRVEGLGDETSLLVRRHDAGAVAVDRIDRSHPNLELGAREAPLRSFFWLGLGHALEGLDHLLFLLGVVFLARRPARVALAVTAFTAGHALTLGVATFGAIAVSVPTVELLIALSLVVLAVELTLGQGSAPSLGARHPALFSGGFGLLHGLGFATALGATGLSPSDRVVPLVGFHLGIEAAQLGVVLLVLGLVAIASRRTLRLELPAAYVVGTLGVMMVVERF